jgi:arginine/lysine/ornithine decarboxylase
MDRFQVPVLEALTQFRRRGDVIYGPPGHNQGRGVDPRVLEVLGAGVFESDVLVLNGLDDRRESQRILSRAQDLTADAVGAEQAFFSTCGSRCRKTAMLAVAGPGGKLLISRNAHESVVSAVIVNGTLPVWFLDPAPDPCRLAAPARGIAGNLAHLGQFDGADQACWQPGLEVV